MNSRAVRASSPAMKATKWCGLANSLPGKARKLNTFPGVTSRAFARTVSTGTRSVAGGWSGAACVAVISASSVACHVWKMGIASALIVPVTPTTSSQTSVAMPRRLWRSSHRSRGRRGRTVPNRSFRHHAAIEDDARDQRQHEEQAHRPQEERPLEPGVEVDVEALHYLHEAALLQRVHVEVLARPRVVRVEHVDRRALRRRAHADEPDVWVVGVADDELHVLVRVASLRVGDHGVDGRPLGRDLGQRGRLDAVPECVVDLVGEDEREPGHAQEQQEERAPEARPLVDEEPGAEGSGAQHERAADVQRAARPASAPRRAGTAEPDREAGAHLAAGAERHERRVARERRGHVGVVEHVLDVERQTDRVES